MQNSLKYTWLIFIVCLSSTVKSQHTNFHIGQKSITYTDLSRKRPLRTEIWYPTTTTPKATSKGPKKMIFKTIATTPNAALAPGKFPLLMVSHGTGGNRFSLNWLVAPLVKKGYIVVSLDHYGNNTFHKLPREFVKWWERAIDVQYVLSQVLKDAVFAQQIDASRIGGIGFSLGGYTQIALAGGYVNRDKKKGEVRKAPPELPKTKEKIDFDNDPQIMASYKKYKDLVKDLRIKAFFVMAPAIGFGFRSSRQTETITAPVFIVAGKGDTNTPIKENALIYDQLIKTSKLHLLGEQVDHYIFLGEGTTFGKKVAPAITVDRPGVNRANIHQEVTRLASDFFAKHLK